MGKLMTDIEVAEVLNLKVQTLRNWRFQGKGPAYLKLGNAVRYQPEDVQAFREQNRVSTEQ